MTSLFKMRLFSLALSLSLPSSYAYGETVKFPFILNFWKKKASPPFLPLHFNHVNSIGTLTSKMMRGPSNGQTNYKKCTATALSPKVIITAAHCVSHWPEDKKKEKKFFFYDLAQIITFRLQYNGGYTAAKRSGKVVAIGNTITGFHKISDSFFHIVSHLENNFFGPWPDFNYANDWAIVVLKSPLPEGITFPKLTTTKSFTQFEQIFTSGYPLGIGLHGERPIRSKDCDIFPLSTEGDKTLETNCFASHGMSGGPLLGTINDELYYLGVISYATKIRRSFLKTETVSGVNLFMDVRFFLKELIGHNHKGQLDAYLADVRHHQSYPFLATEDESFYPLIHSF